ncbi:hypothetical protein [Tumebacillus permanentifrigoris]|uniref:Uncharacterized protein n=1 Tax=Tumebacillus permanentifrigoris TaxID=378543 RepID=A0A316D2Z8_9BACL|nr:hypothetical protein [Tumebacillus permanentifrigoris]PWK05301.1 hypothetical protein C7459_12450 [Tumebacillus permanentifrigoris]
MAALDILASSKPIPLGTCRIVFDPDNVGGAAIIDRTKGGCHYKYKLSTENITMDQTGDTPADILLTGAEIVIEVPVSTADLELINRLTPASTIYTNATTSTKTVEFTIPAGTSLLQYAKKVRVEPLSGDPSQTITVFKAIPIPDWDQVYDPKSPHIKMVRLIGVVDQSKRNRTFCLGPEENLPA